MSAAAAKTPPDALGPATAEEETAWLVAEMERQHGAPMNVEELCAFAAHFDGVATALQREARRLLKVEAAAAFTAYLERHADEYSVALPITADEIGLIDLTPSRPAPEWCAHVKREQLATVGPCGAHADPIAALRALIAWTKDGAS